jgi:hypothetical protein
MSGEVYLAVIHGEEARPVADLLRGLLAGKPGLLWAEPSPTRWRLEGFKGLWGDPASLVACLDRGVVLEEARLFWTAGAVHLLACGGGTRWSAFWEPEGTPRPDWLAPLVSDAAAKGNRFGPLHAHPPAKALTVQPRDLARYGLRECGREFDRRLSVTEYRRGTELVFWNLEEVKKHE